MVLEMEKQWRHVGSTCYHHYRHVESHIVISKKGKLVDMQNFLLHFLLVLVVSVATTYKKNYTNNSRFFFSLDLLPFSMVRVVLFLLLFSLSVDLVSVVLDWCYKNGFVREEAVLGGKEMAIASFGLGVWATSHDSWGYGGL